MGFANLWAVIHFIKSSQILLAGYQQLAIKHIHGYIVAIWEIYY